MWAGTITSSVCLQVLWFYFLCGHVRTFLCFFYGQFSSIISFLSIQWSCVIYVFFFLFLRFYLFLRFNFISFVKSHAYTWPNFLIVGWLAVLEGLICLDLVQLIWNFDKFLIYNGIGSYNCHFPLYCIYSAAQYIISSSVGL